MTELSNEDLLSRMRNFEDHFVERKTSGDSRDWIKTVVAFANSAPISYPCVLYLGVRDTGEIESPQTNLDSMQKSFNKEMEKIYPRVAYLPRIIEQNGRQALAIMVFGSELRPHFGGPSYVRQGSETFEASKSQFDELIASRNSKVYQILAFKGKPVTAVNRQVTTGNAVSESVWNVPPLVIDCNQFWVTLGRNLDGNGYSSFPLSRVEINFDHAYDRLRLEITR